MEQEMQQEMEQIGWMGPVDPRKKKAHPEAASPMVRLLITVTSRSDR